MKEPHNYRKVGYSMIVISVSLVAIGLLVWAIGNNYHFASDLMDGQEIGAMTPKNGYNIVSFDDSQPVGAKLKLLDHAGTNETALQLKEQHTTSGTTILIFDSSLDDNKMLIDKTRSELAQITQGKASAAAAAATNNSTTQSTPPVKSTIMPPIGNTSATIANHGNESVTITEKVNTAETNKNQTTTNGSKKSVNLSENVGITSK